MGFLEPVVSRRSFESLPLGVEQKQNNEEKEEGEKRKLM